MNKFSNSIKSICPILGILSLILFSSCTSSEPKKVSDGYKCIIEIWTEHPTEVSFWGCTWHGNLTQDGRKIPSNSVNILKDIGKYPIEKYYKTEFITSKKGLLTINFWISHNETLGLEPLKVSYKSRIYDGNKLIKEKEKKDFLIGILGQNFQASTDFKEQ